MEWVSSFETTPERCFGNKIQWIWGSCKIFRGKWSVCWIILLKILPRDCLYLWCSQNVVFLQSKRNSDFLSKLFISSVSGEYRNFLLRKLWVFRVSLVIVTLVGSRDRLTEQLLWSFVIAPLLSFSLNFCKGTITVIVLKSEYRCNAVFAVLVTSVHKKCPKSNWIYCLEFWVSVIVARLVTNCYCEKLFLSLFLFRVFFVVVVTK